MSLLRLDLNKPAPDDSNSSIKGDLQKESSSGINTKALSTAPKYSEFVPSMHSNMTMTSPLPPKEPEYALDATLEEKVVAVIKTCYDPEIPVDIYQLGLIYNVLAPENPETPDKIKVIMTLTAPNCPAAQTLPAEVKYKIERLEDVAEAEVEITFDPPWTPEKMSEEARLVLNLV